MDIGEIAAVTSAVIALIELLLSVIDRSKEKRAHRPKHTR